MTNFFRSKTMLFLTLACGLALSAGCRQAVTRDSELARTRIPLEEGQALARQLRIEWHTRLPIDVVRDIYMDAGRIYVESAYGHLLSVDPVTNGNLMWITPTRQVLEYPPTTSGDRVFFFTAGVINVVDRETGTKLVVKDPSIGLAASPHATERLIMAATVGGRVHGIGLDSLWPEWTANMAALPVKNGVAFTPPDVFVVATMDGDIRRYDAVTGSMRWSVETGGYPLAAAPLATSHGVFFGARDGFVSSLDHNGLQRWRKPIGGIAIARPAYAHEKLFVITLPNTLVAMDAWSGDVLWRREGVGRFLTATSERAYFLSPGARSLIALNMADGELVGQLETRDFTRFVAEPETGRFYAATRDGQIYGFVDADMVRRYQD
jgi:outer membrane protein assembly factor BamB